eukprot:jgi/Chlat1/2616/Chrsp178S02500
MATPAMRFSAEAPPLALLAAAKLAAAGRFAMKAESGIAPSTPPHLLLQSGDELSGLDTLLRFFGREGSLYGSDAYAAGEVDQWLEYSSRLVRGAQFAAECAFVDQYLSMRTFLVGSQLSLADLVIWGRLAEAVQWEALRKSNKVPHLSRWYAYVDGHPVLMEVAEVYVPRRKKLAEMAAVSTSGSSGGPAAQAAKKAKEEKVEGSFDIDLPGAADGLVVTRFPPEPSGYLHIGHAKAALLNDYFAKKFKGKLILRFDDTNPSKEKDEFVENILVDLDTLGIKYDDLTYTSDYFEEIQAMAEKLIREGKAYVDDTDVETMRAERLTSTDSKNRDASAEDNLKLWREMLAGSDKGKECCLRAKLDMKSPNGTMRDPVLYRCNPTLHHRTGSKYKAYPTYDLACPYVDSKEGVTHALRSSEYHDREEQYYAIIELMGIRKPHLWDFSRLNFAEWKVGTTQGFRLYRGASKNQNLMEWDKLWTLNKKLIDPVCPRHTAVLANNRVLVTVTDGPAEPYHKVIPRHKKFEGAGTKATLYSSTFWLDQADAREVKEQEEVTLMDWGNAIVTRSTRSGGPDSPVIAMEAKLHLEGSVKTTRLKLTWLADTPELLPLSLVEFDNLISRPKLEEGDKFEDFVKEKTRWEVSAIGDSNMRNLQKGEIIQLERKGYFIVDVPHVRAGKPVVLLSIPDGRQKAILPQS